MVGGVLPLDNLSSPASARPVTRQRRRLRTCSSCLVNKRLVGRSSGLISPSGCAGISSVLGLRGRVMTQPVDRRQAVKSIVVVIGGVATTLMLPSQWTRPVINSVVVPANAQQLSPATVSRNNSIAQSISASESAAQSASNSTFQSNFFQSGSNSSLSASASNSTTLSAAVSAANASASAGGH